MVGHPARSALRIALIDSGCGLLPTAGWLRHLRPDLALDLYLDPEGMPWGSKPSSWIVDRVVDTGRLAVERGADAVVVPCNTASVTAIVPLRAALEPDRPVVATVPAVKPAGATGVPFAVWATERTTVSDYQRDLLERFAAPGQAESVACPGLATAVEHADAAAVREAVALAASRTPERCRSVVLGCTHYPLVVEEILAALPPGTALHDSSRAVAGQALRRLGVPEDPSREPAEVRVHLGGDEGPLPPAALAYPVGRGPRPRRADRPRRAARHRRVVAADPPGDRRASVIPRGRRRLPPVIPVENIRDWRGRPVVDPVEAKIGDLEAVYVDTLGDEPVFATIKMSSLFGKTKLVFVPLGGAVVTPAHLKVAFGRELVREAPSIDPDGELHASDEPGVFSHYGLEYRTGSLGERRLARR